MRKQGWLVLTSFLIPVTAAAESIDYVGSSTIGKFITDAAGIYAKSPFWVSTRPESAGGELCAVENKCDIGGVARELDANSLSRGVTRTLIGRDAIAVIVHADNPLNNLSSLELEAIFTGKITNWSQVGGPNLPLKAYVVNERSATRHVFRELVLHHADYQGVTVVEPDPAIVSRVAADRGGIGHISLSFLRFPRGVKAVSVNGDRADVNNPRYPISRPLYLVTPPDPPKYVTDFIDWAVSDEGQAILKRRFIGIR